MGPPIIYSSIEYRVEFEPAIAPRDVSPINSLPRDVLLIIFKMLRVVDLPQCALTCRAWLRHCKSLNFRDEKKYCEAQCMARRNVLDCFLDVFVMDTYRGQKLLSRANRILIESKSPDFTQFTIPTQGSMLPEASAKTDSTRENSLLIDMQECIEKYWKIDKKAANYFFFSETFLHSCG